MMLVSLGLGVLIAAALITVVSVLTGAPVKSTGNQPTSVLQGKTIKAFTVSGVNQHSVVMPWKDGQPTVLLFFARTCSICHEEMPRIAPYLDSLGSGSVRVVGDDNNESMADAQWFVHAYHLTFPVAFDPSDDVISGIFGFEADPYTVFLNAHGVVEEVHGGAITVAELKAGVAAIRS